ncbi:MAG: hypothetical protein ACNYZH_09795, partial [Acidimicrobiia bacterium]
TPASGVNFSETRRIDWHVGSPHELACRGRVRHDSKAHDDPAYTFVSSRSRGRGFVRIERFDVISRPVSEVFAFYAGDRPETISDGIRSCN